jgi:ribulose-phosphate 3-epimerase
MDGVFVNNISFVSLYWKRLKRLPKNDDVHIMIVHPENYVTRFAKAGAGMLTFIFEAA